MNITEIMKRIPAKYYKYIDKIEEEPGLCDNCKYMLYFARGWAWSVDYTSLPCKSIKEVIEFVKNAEPHKESGS